MTNPLIQKFYELHPEKKQTPKVIKAENFKVEIKPKVQYELDKKFSEQLNDLQVKFAEQVKFAGYSNPSDATAPYNPSANTKASTSIKSYDVNSVSDSFFQVAEKIKDGTAKVTSMNMEYDNVGGSFMAGQRITFEVYVYEF